MDPLDRLDQPLDPLDEVGCGGAEGVHDSAALFLDGHGLERLLFRDLGGRQQVRLAEVLFLSRLQGLPGQPFRRQARGDILRPLDLMRVAVLINLLRRGGAADGFCARLLGIAIGLLLLLLPMSHPAAGAEAHATPAPGEIPVIHT